MIVYSVLGMLIISHIVIVSTWLYRRSKQYKKRVQLLSDRQMEDVLNFMTSLPENRRQEFIVIAKILSDSHFDYSKTLYYALRMVVGHE